MAFSLENKVALITGAGRGIGAAIARQFANAGAKVILANRTVEYCDALAKEINAQGQSATSIELGDLSRQGLKDMVDNAVGKGGQLDILVHNAGGCPWGDVEELSEDQLELVLNLNLKSCFWLAQAALPYFRKAGQGRFLVTSSISSSLAFGGGAHYSAAKAGVNAFIRGAGFEFARENITVNGVEPGFIAKPGRGKMGQPEAMSELSRHIPMGQLGEADDIAAAMLFLASDEAKYITGQTLIVDGGASLPETGYAVESKWGL